MVNGTGASILRKQGRMDDVDALALELVNNSGWYHMSERSNEAEVVIWLDDFDDSVPAGYALGLGSRMELKNRNPGWL